MLESDLPVMAPKLVAHRPLAASACSVSAVVLQSTTAAPEVGPEELVEYWPLFVRVGWFSAGLLTVVLLSRILVQPALERMIRRRNRNNPTLQAAIVLYFRVLVVFVAFLVAIAVAGYGRILGESALIISAVALAIGIAAQEVIGSLVSGVALVLDPEFNVGDYIEWPGGEGVVQSIALRVTRVETPDGELVTIPNTVLTSNELVRPYGRGNHRVIQKIGLAYDDDVDEAVTHLEDVATSMEMILAEPAPTAYVDELGDDAVIVRIHYWIEDPNRRDIFAARSAYASAIKRRFETVGITISPPSERDLQGRISVDESV